MTAQDAREYLEQYKACCYRELRAWEKLTEYRQRITSPRPAARLDLEKVQGGYTDSEQRFLKLEKLEEQHAKAAMRKVEKQCELTDTLLRLQNADYSELLYLRYISLLTWEKVAEGLNKDVRCCIRGHGKALLELAQLLT